MAMNEQIQQIIDLDRQASVIALDAEKKAAAIAEETGRMIKARREEVLQATKATCRQNYDAQIQLAEEKKNKIISDMCLKLDRVREAYHIHQQTWTRQILEELLQSGN